AGRGDLGERPVGGDPADLLGRRLGEPDGAVGTCHEVGRVGRHGDRPGARPRVDGGGGDRGLGDGAAGGGLAHLVGPRLGEPDVAVGADGQGGGGGVGGGDRVDGLDRPVRSDDDQVAVAADPLVEDPEVAVGPGEQVDGDGERPVEGDGGGRQKGTSLQG